MKRMTSKQIEFEASKIFGAKWKNREQTGSLVDQLQAAGAEADLDEIKRESLQYLIEAAKEL